MTINQNRIKLFLALTQWTLNIGLAYFSCSTYGTIYIYVHTYFLTFLCTSCQVISSHGYWSITVLSNLFLTKYTVGWGDMHFHAAGTDSCQTAG